MIGRRDDALYYEQHEPLLTELLDEVIEKVTPQEGDVPAEVFAVILAGLRTRHDVDRLQTLAALAIMRAAGATRPDGAL